MRRPVRIVVIVAGVLVFALLSGLLARWLSLENVERDAELAVLHAEVKGNVPGMLAQLHACDTRCRSGVRSDARRLRRSGALVVLASHSDTAYALTSRSGWTRVAWRAGTHLPVVQCFRVARTGNALSGLSIRLLRVSVPIPGTSDC